MTDPREPRTEEEKRDEFRRRRRVDSEMGASIGEPPEAHRPAYPVRPERMS